MELRGTWKLSHWRPGEKATYWFLVLDSKDGKLFGRAIPVTGEIPETTIADLKTLNGRLTLSLRLQDGGRLSFEARLPSAGVRRIPGSLLAGTRLMPAQLEMLSPKVLADATEIAKELLTGPGNGPEVVDAALFLIRQAGDKKANPEQIRGWAERAFKAAEPHGTRYQCHTFLQLATALVRHEGLAPVALEYARRAERLLEPRDRPLVQKEVLDVLAETLKKAGRVDEAREVEARSNKIEPVRPSPYFGRRAKSDRVVLVELFTGAQCPPCVAADLAFDALLKTYKPTEIVCLQYHEHIPGPDPLTNSDSEARLRYYVGDEGSTPLIFFNGKPDAEGGGSRFNAHDKYEEYLDAINPLLETPAAAKLKASATRKGAKIEIAAEASEVTAPENHPVKLRVALVEEVVNYTGGNKLPTHHKVVRTFPGGVEGVPIKGKTAKQSVTVDLEELRKSLNRYLDDLGKDVPGIFKDRPMEFKNFGVAAFVQDDSTKEVLQAVQVPVTEQK